MMFGGVQITGRGVSGFRLEDVSPKESANPFVEYVRQCMDAGIPAPTPVAQGSPVSAPSAPDEIERFGELLAKGLITQNEFDAKKRQILGL